MQKNNDYKVFTPFVLKRLSGAEAIAKSSKAKGGDAMLTYEHYNAKLPIYKAARANFDVEKAKKEFSSLQSKLSYSMEQTDFQKLMGELEVLGELIIKHEGNQKEKMASGGMTAGRWYSDNKGGEYRFIGQDSSGNSLFNDGEKTITKSLEDFEDSPKEKKLFKFFKKGGEAKPKKAKAAPKPKEKVKLKMYGE
jgi:hypothetical protein